MARLGEENNEQSIIDWQKIDTILLDLDGTLLDLNFDLHFWLEYLPLVDRKSTRLNSSHVVISYAVFCLKKKKKKKRKFIENLWILMT